MSTNNTNIAINVNKAAASTATEVATATIMSATNLLSSTRAPFWLPAVIGLVSSLIAGGAIKLAGNHFYDFNR